MFLSANAGKRSLALSLRDPRGLAALLRLVDEADVFLQSLRPGLAAELGLGADALRGRSPRLVYCSVGAYGHKGPLSHEPGYDALMQAAGGLISMTGEPGHPGVRVGSSLIDQGTGTWAALGILAALLERGQTGEGCGGRCLALRDGTRIHRLPPRGLPGRRHRPARPRHALPDGGALSGVPDARRRADDRRRQRPAVRFHLRRRRVAVARRRSPLPHESRSGAQPRRARRPPGTGARRARHGSTGTSTSPPRASRRRPSPTSPTSRSPRRPRRWASSNLSTIRRSPTCGSPPCHSRSTASGRCTGRLRRRSERTQTRYCVRQATSPTRSRPLPQRE